MTTIPVKDANNSIVDLEKPLPPGRASAAVSRPVALSSEDLAVLGSIVDAIQGGGEYETVAASSTNQVLGATGAAGDYLAGVLIVPTSISPGPVTAKDGAGTPIPLFAGGASSLSNLVPFFVPLGIKSISGAWSLTTGAALTALVSGNFT